MRPDVVLVSDYPQPGRTRTRGGVASYTANLAAALTHEGARVVVVAPQSEISARIHDDGVTVEPAWAPGPLGLPRAVAVAQRHGAPVVHLQHEALLFGGPSSLLGLPGALTSLRRSGSAVAVTLHQVVMPEEVGSEFLRLHRVPIPGPLARRGLAALQGLLVGAADGAVVHERAFARALPGSVVIPHGVTTEPPPERAWARRRLKLPRDDRLVVLCFGFVAPYKGLEVALEAAAGLPRVRLVVAGGPHPRFEAYARRLRTRWRDVADFVGYVPENEVPFWHAAADLALFCYPRPHSSSGALALALGCGTPFMASRPLARCVGAPVEVTFGAAPGELARRLGELAVDRSGLQPLRWAARRMAAGRSWREVARRHLDLYSDLGDDGSVGGVPGTLASRSGLSS